MPRTPGGARIVKPGHPPYDPGVDKSGRPTMVKRTTGRSSVWLERTVRDREVAGSNPVAPNRCKQHIPPTVAKATVDGILNFQSLLFVPATNQVSAHRFLHERADPCLFGGSQLHEREGD